MSSGAAQVLRPDEMALPAICGQTGHLFVMVAQKRSGTELEILRFFAMPGKDLDSIKHPTFTANAAPGLRQTPCRELAMTAIVETSPFYGGCPHCHEKNYFFCSRCQVFSCLNVYNHREHGDHHDHWCQGCRTWRSFTYAADGETVTHDLVAYAQLDAGADDTQRKLAAPQSRGGPLRANSSGGLLR